MVGGLAIRNYDSRPGIVRSRSHTLPSTRGPIEEEATTPTQRSTQSPKRPRTARSNSYLHPTELKPRATQTEPTATTAAAASTRTSRLHIPGTSHRDRDGSQRPNSRSRHRNPLRGHRHTQSEADPNATISSTKRPSNHTHRKTSSETFPHLVANLNAERATRDKNHQQNQHPAGPSRSTTNNTTSTAESTWNARINDLVRISTGPYRGNVNPYALNSPGDAAFGPSGPFGVPRYSSSYEIRPPSKPKTEIELLLERGDARKVIERGGTGATADEYLARRQKELNSAQEELRARLADVNRVSGDITRRLDYTYYSLLEKVGNLVGTISSFQSLSTQSHALVQNFEAETAKLDNDIRARVRRFKIGFTEREGRVEELSSRGERAGEKARELGVRLQNARVIVENWEKREEVVRLKMWRVCGAVAWTVGLLVALLIGVVVWKEWWFRGDPVLAGLGVGRGEWAMKWNESESGMRNVPEEVRVVLQGIEERRVKGRGFASWGQRGKVDMDGGLKVEELVNVDVQEDKGDARLRLLDEL